MAFSPHFNVQRQISATGQINPPNLDRRALAFARMDPAVPGATQAIAYQVGTGTTQLNVWYSKDTYSGEYLGRTWIGKGNFVPLTTDDAVAMCATQTKIALVYCPTKAIANRMYWRTSADGFTSEGWRHFYLTGSGAPEPKCLSIIPAPDLKSTITFYIQGSYLVAESLEGKFTRKVISHNSGVTVFSMDCFTSGTYSYVTIAGSQGLRQIQLRNGHTASAAWGSNILVRNTTYGFKDIRTCIHPVTGRPLIISSAPNYIIHQSSSHTWDNTHVWTASPTRHVEVTASDEPNTYYIWWAGASDWVLWRTTVRGTGNSFTYSHTKFPLASVPVSYFAPNPSLVHPKLSAGHLALFKDDQIAWMQNELARRVFVFPTEGAANWISVDDAQSPDPDVGSLTPEDQVSYIWKKQNVGGIEVNEGSTLGVRNVLQEDLAIAKRNDIAIFFPIRAGFKSNQAAPNGTIVQYELLLSAPNSRSPWGIVRADSSKFKVYDITGIIGGGGSGVPILDDDLVVGLSSRNTFWQFVTLPDQRLVLLRGFSDEKRTGIDWALFNNLVQTKLVEDVDEDDLVIKVESNKDFPEGQEYAVRVDDEWLIVLDVNDTEWTVERGSRSTNPARHRLNTPVTYMIEDNNEKQWHFWFAFNSVAHPYWSDFGVETPAVTAPYNYVPMLGDQAGLAFHVAEFPSGLLRQEKREQAFYYLDLMSLVK